MPSMKLFLVFVVIACLIGLLGSMNMLRGLERETESSPGLSVSKGVESPETRNDDSPWNISVIIATCNRPHSLQEAIESTLGQTYPVHEILVAVDRSDACVRGQLRNIWNDDRVRILEVPPCSKPCGAAARLRNHAMENARPTTTHFAFLDDDDVWYPEKTQVQVAKMLAKNYCIASTDAARAKPGQKGRRCNGTRYVPHDINDRDQFLIMNTGYFRKSIAKRLGIKPKDPFPTHVTLEILKKTNIFVTSSVIAAKSIMQRFNESTQFKRSEDYELWKRILKETPALFIPEPLVIYDNFRNKRCELSSTSPLIWENP